MSGSILLTLLAVELPPGNDPASELRPPVRLEVTGKPIDSGKSDRSSDQKHARHAGRARSFAPWRNLSKEVQG